MRRLRVKQLRKPRLISVSSFDGSGHRSGSHHRAGTAAATGAGNGAAGMATGAGTAAGTASAVGHGRRGHRRRQRPAGHARMRRHRIPRRHHRLARIRLLRIARWHHRLARIRLPRVRLARIRLRIALRHGRIPGRRRHVARWVTHLPRMRRRIRISSLTTIAWWWCHITGHIPRQRLRVTVLGRGHGVRCGRGRRGWLVFHDELALGVLKGRLKTTETGLRAQAQNHVSEHEFRTLPPHWKTSGLETSWTIASKSFSTRSSEALA